jgi:hypothetical protein
MTLKQTDSNNVPAGHRQFSMHVPDDQPYTLSETQHGMRRPDGSVEWIAGGDAYSQYSYANMAADESKINPHWRAWREDMNKRATKACIDHESYVAGHELVTRHVTVVVTEAEQK